MSREDLEDEAQELYKKLIGAQANEYHMFMYHWALKGMDEACRMVAVCKDTAEQTKARDQWTVACFDYREALEVLYPNNPAVRRACLHCAQQCLRVAMNKNPHWKFQ